MTQAEIQKTISFLNPQLQQAIMDHGKVATLEAGTEFLREGQYVKVIPIVLKGLVKVFSRYDNKELLLYYIKPSESCIMSFSAGMERAPSPVYAVTEEETTALLLPTTKVSHWTGQFPDINTLFFNHYNKRYSDLLNTINHLLFDKLDVRILDYLKEKSALTNKNPLKISHKQIAQELGTAREVVSRLVKKLEIEGLISQEKQQITIL